MRPVEEIAWDLCCLYYSSKEPINSDGKLEYFLVGSLATLPLLCTEKIEDVIVDENNNVVSIENCQEIDEQTKLIFQQYRRQIHDIDYVSVNSEPNKSGVMQGLSSITDIDTLSSVGQRVIHVSDPREQICNYNLCRLTYSGRQIIIPSPIDIVSFKLCQCVGRKRNIAKWSSMSNDERAERIIRKNTEEYYKQIRDIIPLLIGIANLYPIDRISYRIREVLESSNDLDFDLLNEIMKDFESYPVIIEIFNNLNSKKL